MKNKAISTVMCLILCMLIFPVTAFADIGPKPSVRISFENMGDELCYGTLIAEQESTGPYSLWDGTDESAHFSKDDDEYEIWKKFVDYKDSDGYNFLQFIQRCDETKSFSWIYRCPDRFKLLLYYPESDTFVSSGIYDRYAFKASFSAVINDNKIDMSKNYNFTPEIISLVIRVILTVLIEIGLALAFGYKDKKSLLFITVINIITNIGLNVVLNVMNYQNGPFFMFLRILLLEIFVFVIEAIAYKYRFGKNMGKGHPVLYAFTANLSSYLLGLLLFEYIPQIF